MNFVSTQRKWAMIATRQMTIASSTSAICGSKARRPSKKGTREEDQRWERHPISIVFGQTMTSFWKRIISVKIRIVDFGSGMHGLECPGQTTMILIFWIAQRFSIFFSWKDSKSTVCHQQTTTQSGVLFGWRNLLKLAYICQDNFRATRSKTELFLDASGGTAQGCRASIWSSTGQVEDPCTSM